MPQLNRRSDCTLNTLRALFTLAPLIAFADARPAVAQTLHATFIGGATEDSVRDIAFDSAGNFYVTGGTGSANFPTTDGTTINAGSNGASFGGHDVWVAKYSPSGVLLWCTAFGGDGYDRAYAIEANATGVYVAGRAGTSFPTTAGVLQTAFTGDSDANAGYGPQEGFVAKLDADGARQWVTYFGDPGRGFIRDIALDDTGAVYLAMTAALSSPYITAGAYETQVGSGYEGVIAKLAPDGESIEWATYLGGNGEDLVNPAIRLGSDGTVYVGAFSNSTDFPVTAGAHQSTLAGGFDLTLTALTADGSALVFSTYLGGSGGEGMETHSLAVSADRLFVTGGTDSSDLDVTAGVIQGASGGGADALLAVFDLTGTRLATSYLGGSANEEGEGIAVLPDGRVALAGTTSSSDLMTTHTDWQGSTTDGYVAVLSADLTRLELLARIGGGGIDQLRTLAVSSAGVIGFGGHAESSDFPVTDGSPYRSTGTGMYQARDAIAGTLTIPLDLNPTDGGTPEADAAVGLADASVGEDASAVEPGGPRDSGTTGGNSDASDPAAPNMNGESGADGGATASSEIDASQAESGCGCRATGSRPTSLRASAWLMLLAFAAQLARRARMRSAPARQPGGPSEQKG